MRIKNYKPIQPELIEWPVLILTLLEVMFGSLVVLLFKVFLKFIFNISISKLFKYTKKINLKQKKIKFFLKYITTIKTNTI